MKEDAAKAVNEILPLVSDSRIAGTGSARVFFGIVFNNLLVISDGVSLLCGFLWELLPGPPLFLILEVPSLPSESSTLPVCLVVFLVDSSFSGGGKLETGGRPAGPRLDALGSSASESGNSGTGGRPAGPNSASGPPAELTPSGEAILPVPVLVPGLPPLFIDLSISSAIILASSSLRSMSLPVFFDTASKLPVFLVDSSSSSGSAIIILSSSSLKSMSSASFGVFFSLSSASFGVFFSLSSVFLIDSSSSSGGSAFISSVIILAFSSLKSMSLPVFFSLPVFLDLLVVFLVDSSSSSGAYMRMKQADLGSGADLPPSAGLPPVPGLPPLRDEVTFFSGSGNSAEGGNSADPRLAAFSRSARTRKFGTGGIPAGSRSASAFGRSASILASSSLKSKSMSKNMSLPVFFSLPVFVDLLVVFFFGTSYWTNIASSSLESAPKTPVVRGSLSGLGGPSDLRARAPVSL